MAEVRPSPRARVTAVLVVGLLVLTGCDYLGTRGPRTALLGDSVAHGANREIAAAVVDTPARYLGRTANTRQVAQMLPTLEGLVAPSPDRLVVVLGANDAGWDHPAARMRDDVRRFLAQATERAGCVRWLNLPTRVVTTNPAYRQGAARFNRILAEEVARAAAAGGAVAVADFDRWARRHPEAMFGDGLHLAPSGRRQFGRWVATLAARCR